MSSYKILSLKSFDLSSGDVKSFVYSKWLRSLRYENDFFKLVAAEAYWEAYQHYLDVLLSKPESMLRLAVLDDEPDVILGFSVTRANILDYVYVHKHQRRLGIGAKLVPEDIDTITHLTKTGLAIWGTKRQSWKFNPFA